MNFAVSGMRTRAREIMSNYVAEIFYDDFLCECEICQDNLKELESE